MDGEALRCKFGLEDRTVASKNALQESWADANFVAYQNGLKEELAASSGLTLKRANQHRSLEATTAHRAVNVPIC